MNSQNILNYYGVKLDVKLDDSEYFDYQLSKIQLDYDESLLSDDPITYTGLTVDSTCFTGLTETLIPIEIPISGITTISGCTFNVRRRTEKGWTLDFIFNRDSNPWISGSTFYYCGIKDENNPFYYLDNNLSFSFTDDGRIMWEAVHYTGYCETVSGYTEMGYVASGETPTLCTTGLTDNFNITITFDRYKYLYDCDLENEGGVNDYITGLTVTNIDEVISSGATEVYSYTELISERWLEERDSRLGVLRIFLNGRPIYKELDWEEIVPSPRGSDNPIVQVWGGGVSGSTDIHLGITAFLLKQFKYYEEPLHPLHVRHLYETENSVDFDITECGDNCVDVVYLKPSPTPTPSITPTQTPTQTPTPTPTITPTDTPMAIYYLTSGLTMLLQANNYISGPTWNDTSGNGNNMTLYNSPSGGTLSGTSYIEFDGISQYGQTTYSGPSNIGYTFGGWFYLDTVPNNADPIFSRGQIGGGDCSLCLFMNADNKAYVLGKTVSSSSSTQSTSVISGNTWFYLSAVWLPSSNQIRLFLNDNTVKVSTMTADDLYPNTTGWNLFVKNGPGYMNGKVGDLFVYERSLSDAEIGINYNNTKFKYGY